MDAMDPAQRADTLGGPRLVLAGAHAHPVERRGDVLVGPAGRHTAHHRQRRLGRVAAVFAGFWLPDTELRVLATLPVDRQDHLAGRLVDVGDDVLDQRTDKALAGAGRGAACVPGRRKILGDPREVRRACARGRRARSIQRRPTRLDPPQCSLPTPFQLGRDQSVVRVARRIAALCKRRFVAGLLQLQLEYAKPLRLSLHAQPLRLAGRLDRHRLQRPQQLGGDRGIDAAAAKAEAARQPQHQVRPIASIDGSWSTAPGIDNRQAAAATAAADDPSQQSPPTAAGLGMAGLAVVVGRQRRLVSFELGPSDIALVVILDQDLPLLKRFAVAVAPARVAIDERGALLAFPVGVGTGVERVFEYTDDVAVADGTPFEARASLAIRRARKVQVFALQLQQDLARAAEFAEPGKDHPHGLLHAQVRVEAKPGLPVPGVAKRDADAQFAAPRFGTGGIKHAGPEDAELELADAAFHAEQQPVIGTARIVDPVVVDDPRLDQPTELEQVVPVAPVAGEARGVEAEHRPHLSRTEPGDEALETWPGGCPVSGPPEIVVDHLDVAEAPAPGDLDQFVLATGALGV